MKPSAAAVILTKCSAFDQRTIGEADAAAWAEILPDDMPLEAALSAVARHYRDSTERMQPKHLLDLVDQARRERLRDAGDPPIPGDLTYAQEKAWRVLWCNAVKDGATRDQAAIVASEAMNLPPEVAPPVHPGWARQIAGFAAAKGVPAVKAPK